MKNIFYCSMSLFLLIAYGCGREQRNEYYITNQSPLLPQPYTALPLGAIKPKGMLLEMLKRQRSGLTGHLDSIYNLVCGPSNGWLGGNGDGWERGPYWLDGLVPLAYLLDDQELKAKARKWIEWSIKNQRDDGYFGPIPLPEGHEKIKGTQQDNREDWWPRIVMLKVLQQYYSATGDKRVIVLMTNYFRYMLKNLPTKPLDHWTFWGMMRGGDNLAVVYWLYNITGEDFLLRLGDLIYKQTYNWTETYTNNSFRNLNPPLPMNDVNIAQGLKEPVIWYQRSKDPGFLSAVKEGLSALKDIHGFVNGMYGGDELLHGNNPTQGSEVCSSVEMMFSFESILPVTGDVFYADYLEKIAYNVLPAQVTDDYWRKQYFQQANQVMVTNQGRNFFHDNNGHLVFGTTTGFPCCISNMHQGLPKFVQNLWYATRDNGFASLIYGESEVTIKVADGAVITIIEETAYPFDDKIRFTIKTGKSVQCPFHMRIPGWCRNPRVTLNGDTIPLHIDKNIIIIDRAWSDNDKVVLYLPMEISHSWWYNGSVGIERGPLVFALRVGEEWKEVSSADQPDSYWEVRPKTPWNYSLIEEEIRNKHYAIKFNKYDTSYPWNLENVPIVIITKGFKVPDWGIINGSAGMLPSHNTPPSEQVNKSVAEDIELVPYGCTALRISEFPVLR